MQESLVSFSCSFKCHNLPLLVFNMQQTDSRNEFLNLENTEMDTNFIQIDQVFHEIMQFLVYHLVEQFAPKNRKMLIAQAPITLFHQIFF